MSDLPLLSDSGFSVGDFKNKKVLLRTDLNVPLKDGVITDEYRIKASLPTIQMLKESGAEVTVCSHLGRPGGKLVKELSMEPVRKRLNELVDGVEVLENLRFSPVEESEFDVNDKDTAAFVEELISGKDIFVNDAFGACHRKHASIMGPPKYLPSLAGLLLQKEIEVLDKLMNEPKKPFVVIIGGSKVSDKLGAIYSLVEKADVVAIGGAMAFSFLVAKGASIESELVEKDQVEGLASLLNSDLGKKIHLPEDLTAQSPDGEVRQTGVNVLEGWQAKDIGVGTAASYCDLIEQAGTIFWNGPVGVFEDPLFMAGTKTLAEAIAASSAYSVIGGGDSAFALRSLGLEKSVDYLSTGGGATLEFLETGSLVGIDALKIISAKPK